MAFSAMFLMGASKVRCTEGSLWAKHLQHKGRGHIGQLQLIVSSPSGPGGEWSNGSMIWKISASAFFKSKSILIKRLIFKGFLLKQVCIFEAIFITSFILQQFYYTLNGQNLLKT